MSFHKLGDLWMRQGPEPGPKRSPIYLIVGGSRLLPASPAERAPCTHADRGATFREDRS